MNKDLRLERLNDPKPGDAWHKNKLLVLIVIGIVDGFILVSKAYNKGVLSCIKAEVISFQLLTKEEFTNIVEGLSVESQTKNWSSFVESMNLPTNLLDHKHIQKLLSDKTKPLI